MGRSKRRELAREFVRTVQDALQCLVDVHVHTAPAEAGLLKVVHRPATAKLNSDFGLRLQVAYYCRIEDPGQAQQDPRADIAGYAYQLLSSTALPGTHDPEIVAYHYHPTLTPDISFPHMHIQWNLVVGPNPFGKCHFPTGHIALEDFLRLLIRDFSAQPRVPNWDAVFTSTASSRAQQDT